MVAMGEILKFRKKNWQFDFIGGIIYFLLVFFMCPQMLLRTQVISSNRYLIFFSLVIAGKWITREKERIGYSGSEARQRNGFQAIHFIKNSLLSKNSSVLGLIWSASKGLSGV